MKCAVEGKVWSILRYEFVYRPVLYKKLTSIIDGCGVWSMEPRKAGKGRNLASDIYSTMTLFSSLPR
jgi:hypothetical protein